MRAIILIFSLMIVSVQGDCSDCPVSGVPCDQSFNLMKTNCTCSVCVTRCLVRHNRCGVGEECIEVPSDFSTKVKVAKCVPFSGCRKKTCSSKCPVSGYLYDVNGCNTCLCVSLCAELQCPYGCFEWTVSSFTESIPECSPPPPTGILLSTPYE